MRWRRGRQSPGIIASEKGFFELAGRQLGLEAPDAFTHFRDLLTAHMDWADSRKRRHRRNAFGLRIASLILTAASTIVLGIDEIPRHEWIALCMVAVVTVLSGLESFRSWRPLWVLMEEAQYRLNRLRDQLDLHLISMPTNNLTHDQLRDFFEKHQDIWDDVSRRWLGFRELDREPGQA